MKTINPERSCLRFVLSLSVFLVLLFSSGLGNAQDWSRKWKSEVYLLGQNMRGDTTSGLGITLELKDTNAGGLGFGTNINDYINLNWDILFGSMDITGKGFGRQVTVKTNFWGMNLNLDYNILKTTITPMITGGVGFLNFSGSAGGFNFSETDFSYNLGAGFRWDITRHILAKALYRATWTKLKDTDKTIMFAGPALSIGYIF